MLPEPAAPDSIPNIPKIYSAEKIADVDEMNQRRCLEESEQWFENVEQTHLVLDSGKLVLQKERQAII